MGGGAIPEVRTPEEEQVEDGVQLGHAGLACPWDIRKEMTRRQAIDPMVWTQEKSMLDPKNLAHPVVPVGTSCPLTLFFKK